MHIVILHDPNSQESRDFVTALGDPVPASIGSDTVEVVTGDVACVARCPNFGGYPTAIVEVDGVRHMLTHPADWAAVTTWAANPAPASAKPTVMTKYVFSQRFHADEMIQILARVATDPAVALFMKLLDYAQDVDLLDVNIGAALEHLVEVGCLTADRKVAILTP